jgi:hypothetical protein
MRCCLGLALAYIVILCSVPSFLAAVSVIAATTAAVTAIVIDGGNGFHTRVGVEENNVLDNHSYP